MNRKLDEALANRLFALRARIASNFNAGNWEEIGILTGCTDIIVGHDRLLRSLAWNDQDYSGNVLTVLRQIFERDPNTLTVIERYLGDELVDESSYVSSKPSERKITFSPHAFQVPDGNVELDLVAVMMPFAREFDGAHASIQRACQVNGLRCVRADDVWEESVVVQDIFTLIFRATVVVVDFTGKNPNVMYETGIAHTLGKLVVPISQSIEDVPFDMRHHRVAKYLPNAEGFGELERMLAAKLSQFAVPAHFTSISDIPPF